MTISKSDNKIKIIVENQTEGFMNALRRACMFNVPILAIEDVYFTKNSSALYDEIIAHRLGLTPLKTNTKLISKEICRCKGEGCSGCQVKFSLDSSGPKIVTAKELVGDKKAADIICPDMPIVELLEGQELKFDAIAVLGTGKEHMKWSSGLVYFQHYPKITGFSVEGAKHCPKGVFADGKVKNLEACDLCLSCVDKSNGKIKVEGEPNKFILTVESWGQLTPKELITQACNVINAKLKEVKVK